MRKITGRIIVFLLVVSVVCTMFDSNVLASEIKIAEDETVSANTTSNTNSYENPYQPGDYLYENYEGYIAKQIVFDELIQASVFANEDGTPTDEALVGHENIKYAQDHADYVAKANEICEGLSTDAEKAETMYKWIATNMFHDYFYQSRRDIYSPLINYMPNGSISAWDRGGGACADMSFIYMIMCRSQNIPCVSVFGKSGLAHAWNAIYVNNKWYQVDCDADCRNSTRTEDLSDLVTGDMTYYNFELYNDVGITFWRNHTAEGFYNINATKEEIEAAIKTAYEVRGLDNPNDDEADDTGSNNDTPSNPGSNEPSVIPPEIPTQPNTPSSDTPTNPTVKTLKSQKITCKVTKKTYKKKSLKKKSKSFYIKAKAKTKVTYKVSKYPNGGKKYITVNARGKVTIKKGAKKGTYKITVTAKKTSKYKEATKTVIIKVK